MQEMGKTAKAVWKKFGCYVFLPKDSFPKTTIKHISGEEASLDFEIEDDSFQVSKNWADTKAEVKIKKGKYLCIEFLSAELKIKIGQDSRMKEYIQTFASQAETNRLSGRDEAGRGLAESARVSVQGSAAPGPPSLDRGVARKMDD